ncbi:hypothetical protein KBD69_02065 [Candidatus Woesebacteria bacterium]|nr:hypothetical protein [Candidatus Woesebacteria bacterium]
MIGEELFVEMSKIGLNPHELLLGINKINFEPKISGEDILSMVGWGMVGGIIGAVGGLIIEVATHASDTKPSQGFGFCGIVLGAYIRFNEIVNNLG